MNKFKSLISYFSIGEIILWITSVTLISVSYFAFKGQNVLSMLNSLIGVTALLFCAKGNPIGQALCIVFGLFYGYISYTFSYYGEMITYLGMSVPMAIISLVTWLKNPFDGNKVEVKVNDIKWKEVLFLSFLAFLVTLGFFFVLRALNTANLIVSTVSITTSFVAVYLTMRRSPFFAVAYATNDIVLIILWVLASLVDISYVSVVVCFMVFYINDIYGFINWLRMKKRQNKKDQG